MEDGGCGLEVPCSSLLAGIEEAAAEGTPPLAKPTAAHTTMERTPSKPSPAKAAVTPAKPGQPTRTRELFTKPKSFSLEGEAIGDLRGTHGLHSLQVPSPTKKASGRFITQGVQRPVKRTTSSTNVASPKKAKTTAVAKPLTGGQVEIDAFGMEFIPVSSQEMVASSSTMSPPKQTRKDKDAVKKELRRSAIETERLKRKEMKDALDAAEVKRQLYEATTGPNEAIRMETEDRMYQQPNLTSTQSLVQTKDPDTATQRPKASQNLAPVFEAMEQRSTLPSGAFRLPRVVPTT